MNRKGLLLSVVLLLILLPLSVSANGQQEKSQENLISAIDGKKIGVSLYYKGDEWYVNLDKEFKNQGKALGAEMVVQDANGIPETQLAQLDNFAIQECDMIMFCAVDPEGVASKLDEINTPIVGFDEPPVWDELVSFVAWDNYKSGYDMGQYVRDYIDTNNGGKSNIVIFTLAQSPLCVSRAEGFVDGLGELDEDIKIIATQDPENNEEKAMNMIANIKDPFNIVFAVTDPGAFGAVTALEIMNAEGVKVFSCGGYGDKTLSMFTESSEYYEAAIVIPPKEIVKSLMGIAVDYFSGNKDSINKTTNCKYIIADHSDYSVLED